MPLFLRKRSILSLAVVLLLLLGVIGAAFMLVSRLEDDQADVRKSLSVELHLARLYSRLQEVDSSQRGFLLTGKESYLEPHSEAVRGIDVELQALTGVSGYEHLQASLAELSALVRERLALQQWTIDMSRAGHDEVALSIVQSDEGKKKMDEARALIERVAASEQELLNERMRYTLRTAQLARSGVVLALLLALLLGALTIRDGQKLIASERSANLALQVATRKVQEEMEQKGRLEHQLRQSQKLEAIGQLTGGVAHDFNNMLAVVIGSLNLVKRRALRGEKDFMKFVDSALDGAERAAALTHRLLAFARQQPLSPRPVDCNKFVAGMSELLRRTLGETIKVETVLAGGLWRAFADPSELENAIVNLAVNARDAMASGGRLTIETANASLDETYAGQNAGVVAGQYVMICVTDTGAGMSSDVAARAFDPFFTTKGAGKGTGLGLSQVFGFVKQSGGHIKIYSEPGEGTTMKIYLPRFFGDAKEPVAAEAEAQAPIPTSSRDIVVLVVEDEDRMLRFTAEAFHDLGYSVLQADGPAMALRVLAARPDIALLFTDVVMPEMSGRKLAEEALKKNPSLKVVYTTGFSGNAVVHNGLLDRDVNFLAKPFTLEQLARKVSAALACD